MDVEAHKDRPVAYAPDVDRATPAWSVIAALLAVGIVLGALVGLVAGRSPTTYQAVGQYSVLPDSSVDADLFSNPFGNDPSLFVQSELTGMNGDALADSVRRELDLDARPTFTFAQVTTTSVVTVTATATTRQRASEVARAAVQAYREQRTSASSAAVDAALAQTTKQVSDAAAALQATPSGPEAPALQDEYGRLLAQASTLRQDRARIDSVLTQVQAVRVSPTPSSTALATALGAAAGAAAALLVNLLYRRLRPSVGSIRDLVGLDLPVLLPPVPRRRSGRSGKLRVRAAGQALASSLEEISEPPARAFVVTAPGRRVGASFVATELARHLEGDILLIAPAGSPCPDGVSLVAFDPAHPSSTDCAVALRRGIAMGRTVVVDALEVDELALRVMLEPDTIVVLVAGRGISHPTDVLTASLLVESGGGRLAGVVLNDAPVSVRAWLGYTAFRLGRAFRRLVALLVGGSSAGAPAPRRSAPRRSSRRSVPRKSATRRSPTRRPWSRSAPAPGVVGNTTSLDYFVAYSDAVLNGVSATSPVWAANSMTGGSNEPISGLRPRPRTSVPHREPDGNPSSEER